MPVSDEKRRVLEQRMRALNIHESDLSEKFILGTGHGGQKINKTASTVVLVHIPTSIEVKCQKSRSQDMNRFFARRLLTDKLETLLTGKKNPKELSAEKIRRQKDRRARRARKHLL